MKYAEIGTDGTGLKTNNAGSYRITKYGDPDAKRRKHLVVIITADVKTKRIMGIESHVEGTGPSEPETAQKHVREAVMKGINVREFYGDGAFDTNDLFTLVHSIGASPIIKIRKNASTDHHRGSKYRRKAIREYRKKGWTYGRKCHMSLDIDSLLVMDRVFYSESNVKELRDHGIIASVP